MLSIKKQDIQGKKKHVSQSLEKGRLNLKYYDTWKDCDHKNFLQILFIMGVLYIGYNLINFQLNLYLIYLIMTLTINVLVLFVQSTTKQPNYVEKEKINGK